jgi:squalene synthase HpnC
VTVQPAGLPTSGRVLAQARAENFPVASRLFPRQTRRHLLNIYGFARLVDDTGDEAPGDRLRLLDEVEAELDALFEGRQPDHPLMRRLGHTIEAFSIPRRPFDKLIEANRVDQSVHRYATFQELRGYCALSANPVGEVVLRIAERATPDRLALSDSICTGLQLVEFWQDLGEDGAAGRVYVPLQDMERYGYRVDDLMAGVRDERFLDLMRFEGRRTRVLLERGRALSPTLPWPFNLAVRLFIGGGLGALSDLEHRRFDTLDASAHTPRLRRLQAALGELVR